MTLLAPSPQMVALVPAASMLPIVLLALPAGALADTVDRHTLMLVSQVIGALAAALLAALSFGNVVTPAVLLALIAVIGATVALHQPAWQASIGDLVPRKDLPAAVSLDVVAFNTARSIGPAMGSIIIALASPSATFALNGASFIGLIVILRVHRLPCRPASLTRADRRGDGGRRAICQHVIATQEDGHSSHEVPGDEGIMVACASPETFQVRQRLLSNIFVEATRHYER